MSYNFICSWKNAFMTNPPHQCIGYLTDFNGLGLSAALAKDLTVYCPYNNATTLAYPPIGVPVNNTVNVTAVLESFSWNGGTSDPLIFNCYMSQQNASQLRLIQQTTLKTRSISALGWWITNFDTVSQVWFEQVYPKSPAKPSAQINVQGSSVSLTVASQATQPVPNVNMYNVSFQIVPAVNQTADILLATSFTTRAIKPWGLVVA
jgi:hypothetical protein